MTKPFYNTTQLDGEALKDAVKRAKKCEEAVLLIYQHTRKDYGPAKTLELLQRAGNVYPITSVRRSITNLCTAGHLIKNGKDKMVKGMYNDLEHTWSINPVKYPSVQGVQPQLFTNNNAA